MGVYLFLTAIDFPICFAVVRWLGVERVGHAERIVVEAIKGAIPDTVKDTWWRVKARRLQEMDEVESSSRSSEQIDKPAIATVVDEYDHGVVQAVKENQSDKASTIYAIHSTQP